MGAPMTNWPDPLSGAAHEVLSAISALNMEPEPLEPPEGAYLSERDKWAKHAMEHLHATMELLRRAGAPGIVVQSGTSSWERRVEDWKRSEEAARLLDKEGMYELHGLLHNLWSKAVGTAGYDKESWKRFEELLGKAFRTILGPEADRTGYLALIAPKHEKGV